MIDVLAKFKLSNGDVGRIGDIGKTAVLKLPDGATEDTIKKNFLYAKEAVNTPYALGEITNIQVEPTFDGNVDDLKAGDSVVYMAGDLL